MKALALNPLSLAHEPLVTVVMPCLNEERTVAHCVAEARGALERAGVSGEVVVVDNGSTDRSRELAAAAGARVVLERRRGYGRALCAGFEAARGEWIVMADADLSYSFCSLERFVERLRAGADLVMGNRFTGTIERGAMPWLHYWIGNPLLSRFLNAVFDTGVGDTQCGMRAFRRSAVRSLNLRMAGMELASEMVIKASLAGIRVEEVPVTLRPDGRGRSPHLRSFRDGLRHLKLILISAPSLLFLFPGLLLMALGVLAIPVAALAGYGVFTDHYGPNFLFGCALAAVIGAHLIFFGGISKAIAGRSDPVFRDERIERFLSPACLNRFFWCGCVVIAAGIVLAVPVVWERFTAGQVSSPAAWIFAITLFTLGVEIVFGTLALETTSSLGPQPEPRQAEDSAGRGHVDLSGARKPQRRPEPRI